MDSEEVIKDFPFIKPYYDKYYEELENYEKNPIWYDTKEEIDESLKKFSDKIIKLNKMIKNDYCKKNGINFSSELNYNMPLKKFYDNLKKFGEKYKSILFKKELEEVIKEYEYYCYFENISGILEQLATKAYTKAKNRNFKNTEDIIVELHVQINEEFVKCAEVMTLAKSLTTGDIVFDEMLKDIIDNYSKYGYTKSMQILNDISNNKINNTQTKLK